MTWYEAVIPAAVIAILVRLDALFLGPYWSWLQLIPDPGEGTEAEIATKRRRALLRRVAIPGLVGFTLHQLWPSTYMPLPTAGVALLGAALLLWPWVLSLTLDQIRMPDRRVYVLYSLLLALFASSGYLGGLFGSWIREGGGPATFIREEGMAVIVTTVVLVFTTDAIARLSESLRRRRDAQIEE